MCGKKVKASEIDRHIADHEAELSIEKRLSARSKPALLALLPKPGDIVTVHHFQKKMIVLVLETTSTPFMIHGISVFTHEPVHVNLERVTAFTVQRGEKVPRLLRRGGIEPAKAAEIVREATGRWPEWWQPSSETEPFQLECDNSETENPNRKS